jgi:hypothetical protein
MRIPVRFRAVTPALWPKGAKRTPEEKRQRGRFKAVWQSTLDLLDTELVMVGARDIEISIDCPERDIRQDGWPKGDARVRSPGVVVRFTHPKAGELVYPCDTFRDWQDNLRAIALSLEALRAVDRYGVTKSGEQYAGFKALPASTSDAMSPEQASAVIAKFSGISSEAIVGFADVADMAFDRARRRTHPDNKDAGGSHDDFTLLERAKKALDEYRAGEAAPPPGAEEPR